MTVHVGGRACELGFDWSLYQAPRPMHTARTAGYRFVVMKATEGDSWRDPNYRQHMTNATAAGLIPGAYHFARPDYSDGGPYQDGRQEARHFLSVIDPRTLFVMLDLEATVVTARETADFVVGFWDQVIDSGRFPLRDQRVLYVGHYFNWFHATRVREQSVLCVPGYTAHPTVDPDPSRMRLPAWSSDLWPEGWTMWQFTDRGTVAGLHPSDVDVALSSWVEAVGTGIPQDRDRFDRQEDDMPRPNYQFAKGIDHANAHYKIIDLRNGAYPTDKGMEYGPHWYHTSIEREVFSLVANREVDTAVTLYFAAGNNGLDRMYEDLPHVFPGAKYTPPPAGPGGGPVDIDSLVPALVGPVTTEIAQRSSRA